VQPTAPSKIAIDQRVTRGIALAMPVVRTIRRSEGPHNMFITKILPRVLTVAAFATALSSATVSADTCKDVNLNVRNGKTVKIKTLKIEYKCMYDKTWRDESIPNVEVAAGELKLVAPKQDLAGCEGYKMLAMKLHFQAYCGGKWSKEFVTQDDTEFGNNAACGKGRTYEVTVPYSNVCEQIK
jgi:hypothetical protein